MFGFYLYALPELPLTFCISKVFHAFDRIAPRKISPSARAIRRQGPSLIRKARDICECT